MPNVDQGATASYTFPAAQTVTFTLDQGERAVINVTRSGALIANRSISNGETVGPYQAGDVMAVTALRGAVDYDVATYTSPGSGDGGAVTSASVQSALSSDPDGGRTALGLGSAATQAASAFATAAQGTDSREWTAATVDQAEAEAGTATTRRAWTAQRVRQAIAAARPEVATWADLPAANTVTVGRTYTVLSTGWRVYSDGSNWRPASSELLIAARCGSLASPIATLTGVTAAQFVLPVVPTIPAGLISPHSSLWVDFRFRRTTSTASMQISIRLGTAGTTADSQIVPLSMSAVANQDMRLFTSADFGASPTSFSTHSWGAVNGQSGSSANDRSTNINTAAQMFVSADIAAANVADSVSLIAYRVVFKG